MMVQTKEFIELLKDTNNTVTPVEISLHYAIAVSYINPFMEWNTNTKNKRNSKNIKTIPLKNTKIPNDLIDVQNRVKHFRDKLITQNFQRDGSFSNPNIIQIKKTDQGMNYNTVVLENIDQTFLEKISMLCDHNISYCDSELDKITALKEILSKWPSGDYEIGFNMDGPYFKTMMNCITD